MNRQENGREDNMSRENECQEKRHRRKRRWTDYILIAAILVCGIYLCIEPFKNWQQERKNESLRLLAEKETTQETSSIEETETDTKPGETEPEYVSPIDFEVLRNINPDIVAWIKIPGTKIDYPVVQTDNNENYLTKTFEGKESVEGAIYLDCDSDSDLMGSHNIIYGHHMKNKTMFADLVKFKDEAFFKEHREVILYTPERELHLKTIAALYGDADGEKRRTKFNSQEIFESYIDTMTKGCTFRELPEYKVEQLYSFVTCSYEFDNARTILYAVPKE